MLNKIKNAYVWVKGVFNHAWSIVIARLEVVLGIVITAVSTVDLSSLVAGIQTGLTKTQGITIGGLLIVKGIVSEIGRRQGTVTLSDGQLMPAAISEKKEAIAVIKETATKKQKETL